MIKIITRVFFIQCLPFVAAKRFVLLTTLFLINCCLLQAQTWNGTEALNKYLPNNSALVNTDNMDLVTGISLFSDTSNRTGATAFTEGSLAGKFTTTGTGGVRPYLPYASLGTVRAVAYTTPACKYDKNTHYLHLWQSNITDGYNKFSAYSAASSYIASMEFAMLFGNDGVGSAASYTLALGNNTIGSFASSNTGVNIAGATGGIFTALHWQVATGGTIAFSYRNSVAGSALSDFAPVTVPAGFSFEKNTEYSLKLYCNNTAALQYYTDSAGAQYTLAAQTFDIWVNNTLIAGGLPALNKITSGGLPVSNNIGSYALEAGLPGGAQTEYVRISGIASKYVVANTTRDLANIPTQSITSSIVKVADSIYKAPVGLKGWASNSVNGVVFRKNSLVTYQDTQYVAFYDSAAIVMVGKRKTGDSTWILRATQYSGNAADAHNDISIIIDGAGYLHISWDHHGHPLRYARGITPGSLVLGPKTAMTGLNESNVTYPEFYTLPNGDLLFQYRDGASGNGNTVLNRYTTATQTWLQVQSNLISGENTRNAYTQTTVDKLGKIHISWVWRETSDVATNHDMSYAVSADGGVTWQKSTGAAYTIPITLATAEKIATIPQGSELINQTSMTTDDSGRAYIATYWRPAGAAAPQYHIIYQTVSGWVVTNLGFRVLNFSLSGSGTQAIPVARPQILVWKRGTANKAMLIFRDAERGSKVSLATCDSMGTSAWRVTSAGNELIGDWEPSFDTELWRNKQKINVFAQYMLQASGEGSTPTPPQPVYVLQIDTAVRGEAVVVSVDSVINGKWNGTEGLGVGYLPNSGVAPTALTGTKMFNNTTPVATGVTAIAGTGKVTTSTTTTEYYIPKTTTGSAVARIQAYTNTAFTYVADSLLTLRQSNKDSVNKFSIHNLTSSAVASLIFNMELNTTGTADSAAMYAFTIGRESGTNTYNNNTASVSLATNVAGIFGGLAWVVAANGTVDLRYRSAAGTYTSVTSLTTDTTLLTYYTPFLFVKGIAHTVKLWCNNTGTLNAFYTVAGREYKLIPATYDVWINGQKAITGLPSLRKATGTVGTPGGNTGASINAFAFEGVLNGGSTSEYMRLSKIEWKYAVNNVTTSLPVNWLSFTAAKGDKKVVLNWSTAAEINTKSFALERSNDGIHFINIAMVNAAGNSSMVNKYNYTDLKPLNGMNYYRVKQTDADGRFSYSKVVAILFSNKREFFVVYPTLVTNGFASIGFTAQLKDVTVSLLSIDGKLIQAKNMGTTTNGQVVQLTVNHLAPGTYLLRLSSEKEVQIKRLVIE